MSTSLAVPLEKLLANAQLPALPQSAIQILQISQDPESGPAELAVPINADPGLAAQVLKFVNSSYFGFPGKIASVQQAITLVGMKTIKNFVLWSAVFSLMPSPKCGPFDVKGLWRDSLRRALFARELGRSLKAPDCEELFAAALLQDMAVPLLAKEIPEIYVKFLAARDDGRRRLSTVEKAVCRWTHAEAGGMMARQWNLPARFVQLIEQHVVSPSADLGDRELGEAVVGLSAMLPAGSDGNWHEWHTFHEWYRNLVGDEGPEPTALLGEVDELCAELAPLLKMSTGGKTLVEWYEDSRATAENHPVGTPG
ncbi:HDOD domain-containing protein [Thermopirellula anaerolimosa]